MDPLLVEHGSIGLAAFLLLLPSVSLGFTGHEEQGKFVERRGPSILALGARFFASRRGSEA